jgi:hypothetical protein
LVRFDRRQGLAGVNALSLTMDHGHAMVCDHLICQRILLSRAAAEISVRVGQIDTWADTPAKLGII